MPPTPSSPPRTKSNLMRHVVSLALLVGVIGLVAWVVQYLPRWHAKKTVVPVVTKDLLRFEFDQPGGQPDTILATWSKTDPNPFREFEQGDHGHYDFLFKNTLGQDIEIVHYSSTCDCASMAAAVLPMSEVQRLGAAHANNPGAQLPYGAEPPWTDLPRDKDKLIHMKVKPEEGGVVRVRWSARKSAGQELKVQPKVWVEPADDPGGRKAFTLLVPAIMSAAVKIHPQRVNVGVLTPGTTAKAELDIWSATREHFKLDLVLPGPDPFFAVEMTPLAKDACAALERSLLGAKQPARVKSGYHVTITVHENKAGQQLDLGAFLRKFAIVLDGILVTDIVGPEVVGRVHGDLVVGGFDDQGKIRFKSFTADTGGAKTVELLVPKNLELKEFKHQPSWIKVHLSSEKKLVDGSKRVWRLEVVVPPKTPGVRSFTEQDAVVLQIASDPPRLVRIPIEGDVSGR